MKLKFQQSFEKASNNFLFLVSAFLAWFRYFFFQIIFLSRTFDPVEKLAHLSSPNHSANPPFPDLLEILRIRIIKMFEIDETLSQTLLKMAREVKH